MRKSCWNLGDILPKIGSNKYKQLLQSLEDNVKYVEEFRGKLNPNIDINDFMGIVKAQEKIADIICRLGDYAYLWFKNLDDKNAEGIINDIPDEYKYYLRYMRLLKLHTLAENEERIINIKDTTGNNALIKLYDIITNNFVFTLNIKGKKKELTRQQLTTYVNDPDPKVRKSAYQELYKIYSSHSDILNEIYRNVVLDWNNESINLRKYENPIAVRNKPNDISDEAVNTLIQVCRKNRFLFHEYFRLKAKICKIKKMARYDIYTSYNEKKKKYTYEEAKNMVFDAYKNYSDDMNYLARKIIDSNHIDYEIRKNKMGGAYCMYITPRI